MGVKNAMKPQAIRLVAFAVLLIGALAAIGAWTAVRATDGIHQNTYYWDEWAYAPLRAVNAFDCVTQNNAIASAANEWNATGLVSLNTRTDVCDTTSNGIVWRPNSGTANSYVVVDLYVPEYNPDMLDPDPVSPTPPLRKLLHVTIRLGSLLPDGDSTCANYYAPCDVATHEMGHAVGLGDHYTHDGNGYPLCTAPGGTPTPDCFSYGTPTVMDYPHITNIATHDTWNVDRKYRLAPFGPWDLAAFAQDFRRINMGWRDRSHNESLFTVQESVAGSGYSSVGTVPKDQELFGRNIVSPGKQYCYRVYPLNSWGFSGANSNSSCVTPPHSVGTIGGSFPTGSTNIALCWNKVENAGVTYYVVHKRRYYNGTYYNNTYTVPPNTGCYGQNLWQHTVSSTYQRYHWSVKGCNSEGCSNYRDMTSPNAYWVYLPYNGQKSGTPNSDYHSH